MQTIKIALALIAAAALGSTLFETTTKAQGQAQGPSVTIANVPLPVTGTVAHVGQHPSLVVNLRLANNQAARRVDPATGFVEANAFVVPSGYAFLLTDIHTSAVCQPGQGLLYLLFQNEGNASRLRERQASVCNSNGDGNIERHLTTGLVFNAGSTIQTALSPTVDHFAWAEGFLVPID